MATPVLIDLSNYDTHLVLSTQPISGTPDGNMYMDPLTGVYETIDAATLATVDLGAGAEANPLTTSLGIRAEAMYAFERKMRRLDEGLRQKDFFMTGNFKFAGSYNFVNGRKPGQRGMIRGSGWIEYADDGGIDRIYYGNVSLNNIEATSQVGRQLAAAGTTVNYGRLGPVDEAVQVLGSTANVPSDATAGDFDTRTFLSMTVRTFGQTHDEKQLSASGVVEMGGYSTGFALGEGPHLTTGNYTKADVIGGAQIAPWTGMSIEELAVPQLETGFTTADGNFTWVLNNVGAGDLDQCIAFLDASAAEAADINAHATNVTIGRDVGTWYSYNAAGKILPKVGTGAVGEGFFIEGLLGTDKNRVIFTDDAGGTKIYPAFSNVTIAVGAGAVADVLAWFHAFFLDGPALADFNTNAALTVNDASGTPVKGTVNTSLLRSGNNLLWEFDHAADVIGGGAGVDKNCVFEVEGDGGVTVAKTVFLLTAASQISASCVPPAETNV